MEPRVGAAGDDVGSHRGEADTAQRTQREVTLRELGGASCRVGGKVGGERE